MIETEKEYAVALFSVASEEGNEEEVFSQICFIRDRMEEMPEYLALLASPAVSLTEKKALLNEAFSSMAESVVSFLSLLCENGRVDLFLQIAEEYEKLHHTHCGQIEAKVTSAVELTEEQKRTLIQKLETKLAKKVTASFGVDPALLGGIKVEAEGVTFDGSVKKRLTEIKEVLNG